jgi:hypothetical protein
MFFSPGKKTEKLILTSHDRSDMRDKKVRHLLCRCRTESLYPAEAGLSRLYLTAYYTVTQPIMIL